MTGALPVPGLIGERPVIGRHSRPRNDKWPATRDALFEVFPNGGDIQVRLMGLSEKMKGLIGECPSNWQTMETDEIPVREFLSAIDFFVYFHHPDWLEAYGRTVGEAAAAGCVVVLPPYLRKDVRRCRTLLRARRGTRSCPLGRRGSGALR